jgi:hypothetical protein
MVSFAILIASCSSSAGITERTGPKISSCAITEWLSTLPNTVGSTNQPRSRCLGRPPPVASVKPSAMLISDALRSPVVSL